MNSNWTGLVKNRFIINMVLFTDISFVSIEAPLQCLHHENLKEANFRSQLSVRTDPGLLIQCKLSPLSRKIRRRSSSESGSRPSWLASRVVSCVTLRGLFLEEQALTDGNPLPESSGCSREVSRSFTVGMAVRGVSEWQSTRACL